MANMADIKNSLTLRSLPAAQPPITHQPFPHGLARVRVRAARREGGGGMRVRFFLRLFPTHDDTNALRVSRGPNSLHPWFYPSLWCQYRPEEFIINFMPHCPNSDRMIFKSVFQQSVREVVTTSTQRFQGWLAYASKITNIVMIKRRGFNPNV